MKRLVLGKILCQVLSGREAWGFFELVKAECALLCFHVWEALPFLMVQLQVICSVSCTLADPAHRASHSELELLFIPERNE